MAYCAQGEAVAGTEHPRLASLLTTPTTNTQRQMNAKLPTLLAGLVVSVPILFGFLGVLLLVSDSDDPSMQVSFSEFVLKKIAGALLVAVAYFSLRALHHWASSHEADRK